MNVNTEESQKKPFPSANDSIKQNVHFEPNYSFFPKTKQSLFSTVSKPAEEVDSSTIWSSVQLPISESTRKAATTPYTLSSRVF